MTTAQKKKAKAAARRSKQKQQKSNGDTTTKNNNNKKPLTKNQKFVEEDPYGELLLKKDPLDEAKKYTSILSKQVPQFIDT